MTRIFQIKDYQHKPESGGQCYRGAAGARQKLFSGELADLKSERRRLHILRVEDLKSGFPQRSRQRQEQWNYIYSSDLLATLPQVAARQVMRKAVSCLKVGGRLLFANITLKPGEEPACCACARRRWIYRTEYDMADLSKGVPDDIVSGQALFRDASGLNIYLELHRK